MSKHIRQSFQRVQFFILSILLATLLVALADSSVGLAAQNLQTAEANPVIPPTPEVHTVAPYNDPQLPGLSTDLTFNLNEINLGQQASFKLTVTNSASDLAQNIKITLPAPAGTKAISGSHNGFVSQTAGWLWNIERLEAKSSLALTGTLELTSIPTGEAVIAEAQLIADKVVQPVYRESGMLVTSLTAPTGPVTPTVTATPTTSESTVTVGITATFTPQPAVTTTPTLTATTTLSPTSQLDQAASNHQSLAINTTTPVAPTPPGTVTPQVADTANSQGSGQGQNVATQEYQPGQATSLKSKDGKLEVKFSAQSYKKGKLTLQHSFQQDKVAALKANGKEKELPTGQAGHGRGFGIFYLDAVDEQKKAVHNFDEPVTIQFQYTPQQLKALGIKEDNLTVFWFDESYNQPAEFETGKRLLKKNGEEIPTAGGKGRWVPLATQIDPATHTATVSVNHFSAYQFANGLSASSAYLPSVEGWQTDLFTGSGSYSYQLVTPPGPGGSGPGLSLSYSSAATDGKSGQNALQQASWVGKGWSLDVPSIMLNKTTAGKRYYALSLAGQSFDLVDSSVVYQSPNNYPWEQIRDWRATNESFIKVRSDEYRDAGTGTYWMKWQVWTKDGTRYDFEYAQALRQAWEYLHSSCTLPYIDCHGDGQGNYTEEEVYKWYITRSVDTHNNTTSYNYQSVGETFTGAGWAYNTTVHWDAWPTSITWGGEATGGAASDRFKLEFVSSARTYDTQSDSSSSVRWDSSTSYFNINQRGSNRQTRKLDELRILSRQATTWELVHKYNFCYFDFANPTVCYSEPVLYSDDNTNNTTNTSYPKLTLKQIQKIGSDGVTALPPTLFNYRHDRGTGYYPNGGWNRLTSINNGQGGKVDLTYEVIGSAYFGASSTNSLFRNNHRVVAKTARDLIANNFQGVSYTTSYAYGMPAYNSLGTTLMGTSQAPNANPNSAALYYNRYFEDYSVNAYEGELAHAPLTQFRGHSWVRVTEPGGNQTEQYFNQGETACGYPKWPNGAPLDRYRAQIEADSCFQALRNAEFLKGKPYKIRSLGPVALGSPLLAETNSNYTVEFYTPATLPLSGLWRAFSFLYETQERVWNGAATPIEKWSRNYYDTAYQGGTQYGNQTRSEEYSEGGGLIRSTLTTYNINTTGTTYIVDRVRGMRVNDTTGRALSLTHYFYDGQNQSQVVGTVGDLTATRQYHNIPLQADLSGLTLQSVDNTFSYDSYGNKLVATTFADYGTFNVWATSWSVPGNGSATRTTTTEYDTVFHLYPTKTIYPITSLVEQAGYDYRLGLLTSATDPNGQQTLASYDVFGRLYQQVKPGDSWQYPTLQANYYDWEQPMRYLVMQREIAGQAGTSVQLSYYDGLGRTIQTKQESVDGTEHFVTDSLYDAAGRPFRSSTPRRIPGDANNGYWNYVQPNPNPYAMRWTTTTYDQLGRPLETVAPDGTTSVGIQWDRGLTGATIDPKGHRKEAVRNMSGQTLAVRESLAEPTIYEETTSWHNLGSAQNGSWVSPNAGGAAGYLSYGPGLPITVGAPGNVARFRLAIDDIGNGLATSSEEVARLEVQAEWSGGGYALLAQRSLYRHDFAWAEAGQYREFALPFDTTGHNQAGRTLSYRVYWLGNSKLSHDRTSVSWAENATSMVKTTYGYDGAGRLTQTWDNVNNYTEINYDSLGRKTRLVDPDMGIWTYQYKADGLWKQTDAKNQTATYSYDALNRTTAKAYSDGRYTNYTYDETVGFTNGKGQATTVSSNQTTDKINYTARGQVSKVEMNINGLTGSRTFEWTYDSAGRVGTAILPSLTSPSNATAGDREVLSYEYNAAWQPTKMCTGYWGGLPVSDVGLDPTGKRCYAHSVSYNTMGSINNMKYGNGLYTDWGRDWRTLRPGTVQIGTSTTTPNDRFNRSYSYDEIGNVKSIQNVLAGQPTQTITYQYDGLNRLTRSTSTTPDVYDEIYNYDNIGNITSKAGVTYTYPAAGQPRPHTPTVVGGQSYSYDSNGNLTSGSGRSYTWNAVNYPETVTGSDSITETYVYGAADERIKRTRNGVTTFYFGTWEEDSNGTRRIQYKFNGAIAQRTRQTAGSQELVYLHNDQLNSLVMTTNTVGNYVDAANPQQRFDAWGKIRAGSTVAKTVLSYTGQNLDDTGLLYYNARYYDPILGKFISPDLLIPSVKNTQSYNRYSYVLNNPMRYTDPSGHCQYDGNGSRDIENDGECWGKYDTARIALGGQSPAGLDSWNSAQLDRLLDWLRRGVVFANTNRKWTAQIIGNVLDALELVEKALGTEVFNKTYHLCNSGTQCSTTLKFEATDGSDGNKGGTGGGGAAVAPDLGNTIRVNIAQMLGDNDFDNEWHTNLIIHEMGHLFARDNGIDSDPEWQRLHGNEAGAPTEYAKTDAIEDFGDSFVVYVNWRNARFYYVTTDVGDVKHRILIDVNAFLSRYDYINGKVAARKTTKPVPTQ